MSETEFYDIGGSRADPDFIHTKIRVGMESAMVMNHDTDMLEVWVDGVLEASSPATMVLQPMICSAS